jgi:aminoglycoside phosphotransferase
LQERLAELDLQGDSVDSRSSVVLLTPKHATSNSVVAVVVARGTSKPSLIVKIPRLGEPSAALAREAAILRRLERERPGGVPNIPRVIAFLDEPGRQLLIETALEGPALDERVVRRHPHAWLERVLTWLEALPQSASRDVAGAHERLLQRPLQEFAARHTTVEVATLVAETLELVSPLRDSDMPLVVEHGDLRHPNLVRMARERVGVVDWELAEPDGLPLNDLFAFLAYVAVAMRKATTQQHQARAFSDAFVNEKDWVQQAIRAYAQRLELDSSLVTPLFVACWARYACGLGARAAGDEPHSGYGSATSSLPEAVRQSPYYTFWQEAVRHARGLRWPT